MTLTNQQTNATTPNTLKSSPQKIQEPPITTLYSLGGVLEAKVVAHDYRNLPHDVIGDIPEVPLPTLATLVTLVTLVTLLTFS